MGIDPRTGPGEAEAQACNCVGSLVPAKLFAALAKATADLTNPPFDSTNPHYRNQFTSLAGMLDHVRPVLAKHGLAVMQAPQFDGTFAGVVTTVAHSSGESTSSTLLLPVQKSDPQSVGSALTYARRYALQSVLGICGEPDDDAEQASAPAAKPKQKRAPAKPKAPPKQAPTPGSERPAEDVEPNWRAKGIAMATSVAKGHGHDGTPAIAAVIAWAVRNELGVPQTMVEGYKPTPMEWKQITEALDRRGGEADVGKAIESALIPI